MFWTWTCPTREVLVESVAAMEAELGFLTLSCRTGPEPLSLNLAFRAAPQSPRFSLYLHRGFALGNWALVHAICINRPLHPLVWQIAVIVEMVRQKMLVKFEFTEMFQASRTVLSDDRFSLFDPIVDRVGVAVSFQRLEGRPAPRAVDPGGSERR